MKKILMILFAAFTLVACDKEDNQYSDSRPNAFAQIEISNLPQSVANHVSLSYPSATIVRAGKNTTVGYELLISFGWKLFYNIDGNFAFKKYNDDDDSGYTPVLISSLPASIQNYVTANYPSAQIVWAEKDDDGFDVYLSNGYELEFTLGGVFISAELEDIPVNPTELPVAILSYIQQNYPAASITKVELSGNVYEVYLNNGIELYFNQNGEFLGFQMDDLIISINELPQAILDYVAVNYPNQTIVKAEIDDNRYEVELNNEIELYFDLNGNFLFADFD